MLLIIKFVAKLFSVLNSEISPNQIAAGFAFGALLGLIPASGLLPVFFLIIAFVINFNLAALFLAFGVFKIISFFVDPIANQIGFYFLVNVAGLKPFWTALYNMPVIPYLKFNNTIVLGSFVIGVAAFVPLFFLLKIFVHTYRTKLRARFQKLKIVQAVKASTFYKYYVTYTSIGGN